MLQARTARAVRARRTAALLEAIEPRQLMSAATLDPTFGNAGSVRVNFDAPATFTASTVDAQGRVLNATLVEGETAGFYVSRFTTAGVPDGTFNGDGTVFVEADGVQAISDIAVDASGAVYVGVLQPSNFGATIMGIARVGADGFQIGDFGQYVDGLATVGTTATSSLNDLDLVVDGNSVYGVYSDFDPNTFAVTANVAKFDTATGVAVASFGDAGFGRFALPGLTGYITDAVVSNGTLAITGNTAIEGAAQVNNAIVGKIAADGLSATWSTAGVADGFQATNAVALPGGRIVLEGNGPADNAFGTAATLVAFNADGSADATFGAGLPALGILSTNTNSSSLVADADGRLYVAGTTFDATGAAFDVAVARLNADGSVDATFDDDGVLVRAADSAYDYAFSASVDAAGGLFVTTLGDGAASIFKLPGHVVETPPPAPLPFSLTNGVLSYVAAATDTKNDVITVTTNAAGQVVFTLNGEAFTVAGNVTGIKIDGGAGNDLIKISTAITAPATLVGGAGNDSLRGGSGNDVLLGGDGDDAVIGRDGQDFILGGNGRDYLIGREDADILISGNTTLSQAGIDAVMAEWTSSHTFAAKLLNLSGLLPLNNRLNGTSYLTPGITIVNDTSIDTLSGGEGADFYYAQLFGNTADVIRDNLATFRSDVAPLVLAD